MHAFSDTFLLLFILGFSIKKQTCIYCALLVKLLLTGDRDNGIIIGCIGIHCEMFKPDISDSTWMQQKATRSLRLTTETED